MLSSFPLCIEGWIDICDMKMEDLLIDDWKSSGISSLTTWQPKFCSLLERDSELYIFNDEKNSHEFQQRGSMDHYRLDTELSSFRTCSSFGEEVVSNNLSNQFNKRLGSNSQANNKSHSKVRLFRNGSRLFGRGKTNTKLVVGNPTYKDGQLDNSGFSTISSSLTKRSMSLSRVSRKKSDDKPEFKGRPMIIKKGLLSQSTGDLTLTGNSAPIVRYNLKRESIISEIHPSLVGGRANCFTLSSYAEEIDLEYTPQRKTMNETFTTRLFSAGSNLEKLCWMKRLQQTVNPNMENENRINNSLKLTLFESKCLPTQKRKYFCTVTLDKSLYAKTNSKMSRNDGTVFWAFELVLNNLPNFKNLIVSLYKESESFKDLKKKKKKHLNQCIGEVILNIDTLKSQTDLQSWYNLKLPDLFSERVANSAIQLRIKLRFESLKVFENNTYNRLYKVAINNYMELIQSLEKNLPVKLKEEIATCLVNIHEKNGTIIQFLVDLISEEIDDIDNSSMTLRGNTIVTKIIESHMKLVGFQYLHDMLYPLIHNVIVRNDTVEVDPTRYDVSEDQRSKLLSENQQTLTLYLRHVLDRIYRSTTCEFPRQLKAVYVGWRKKISMNAPETTDRDTIENHCDVIISGCIFLRLLCPAILTPNLFGLISYYCDISTKHRTLTLIAKSLQCLANFSKFGEKERFMSCLDSSFPDEIPRMHDFLRSISTFKSMDECYEESRAVEREINYYGFTVDLCVEMARLHKCLLSDPVKELIDDSTKLRNNLRLPEILNQISDLLNEFVPTSTRLPSSNYKSNMTDIRSISQRRSLSSQFINITDQIHFEIDPLHSNPWSPTLQLSDPSQLSSYIFSNVSDGSMANSSENGSTKTSKPVSICSPNRPNNSYLSISKMQVPGSVTDTYCDIDADYKRSMSSSMFFNPMVDENQLQSSMSTNHRNLLKLPKLPPRRPAVKCDPTVHYSKINDIVEVRPASNIYPPNIESSDIDYYRENPLYGQATSNKEAVPTGDSHNQRTNAISRYFCVRTKINSLEDGIKQGNNAFGIDKTKELSQFYRQLHETKKEIHFEQLNDLKQLQTMLNLSKTNNKVNESSTFTNSLATNSIDIQNIATTTSRACENVINSKESNNVFVDRVEDTLPKLNKKTIVSPKSKNSVYKRDLDKSLRPVSIDNTDESSPLIVKSTKM